MDYNSVIKRKTYEVMKRQRKSKMGIAKNEKSQLEKAIYCMIPTI